MELLLSMKGIRILRKREFMICYIDDFSNDLKNIIRSQLSSVCYGPSKASSERKAYNYKNTLREFLRRYESKAKATDIQMGMIGELLAHILIFQYFDEFNIISPYFNLEERSIKKGFDIVLFSKEGNEIWITEVKSGELHKNKNANETNIDLLNTAKRDLKRRLNENKITFWENAINGALIALNNKKDFKDAVIEILYNIENEVIDNKAYSENKNVVLITSLFSALSDEIKDHEVNNFLKRVKQEKIFKNVIVFSIQKSTYNKVFQFFKEEAGL